MRRGLVSPSAASAHSATAMPSARRRAGLAGCRRSALSRPALVTMRSTTMSMSCLNFLSSAGASSIGVELAVDLQPLEARPLPLGDLLAVLALAAADDGGQQVAAASPSGRAVSLSTIWLTVWLSIGRPVAGE